MNRISLWPLCNATSVDGHDGGGVIVPRRNPRKLQLPRIYRTITKTRAWFNSTRERQTKLLDGFSNGKIRKYNNSPFIRDGKMAATADSPLRFLGTSSLTDIHYAKRVAQIHQTTLQNNTCIYRFIAKSSDFANLLQNCVDIKDYYAEIFVRICTDYECFDSLSWKNRV